MPCRWCPISRSLGISHLYASPILKARPGSMHGYDIVDHGQINPELGGEPALRRLVAALKAAGLGLIIDIVPEPHGRRRRRQCLVAGRARMGPAEPVSPASSTSTGSRRTASLSNRMLAPFLGAPYGEVLESGDLTLQFDAAEGRFHAQYFEHRFPIAPQHYHHILQAPGDPAAGRLRPGIRPHRPAPARPRLAREQAARAPRRARRPRQRRRTARRRSPRRWPPTTRPPRTAASALHRLLERQHYRLAWWRAAADEINWRRFFDITSLAGLRVELPEVFDATHELVLKLYAEGAVDGMRIDHVDGLADPRGYCRKLLPPHAGGAAGTASR